jgi:hypothetical protein
VRQQSRLDLERRRRDAQRIRRLGHRLVLANHVLESRLRVAADADQILLRVVDRVLVERRDRFRELELILESGLVGHARLRDGSGESIDGRLVRRERFQRLLKSGVDLLRLGGGSGGARRHAPDGLCEGQIARLVGQT